MNTEKQENQILVIEDWQISRKLNIMPYVHNNEVMNIVEETLETFGLTRDEAQEIMLNILQFENQRETSTAEKVDAYCDLIVYAIGAILKLGYKPTLALNECIKEISDRTGAYDPEAGKWVKEPKKPNAYIANYENAKL